MIRIPGDKITCWQILNYSSVLDPSATTHKVMWEDQRLKFDGIPYFVLGQKIWVSKWRRQEESLETKEKRKETAGMVYSVIINHDKIFQKCFNFFLGGEEGVINNTHLHLNRNKTRNNHWRVNSIWILYSSVICSCSKSYVIGCKLYFCKEH